VGRARCAVLPTTPKDVWPVNSPECRSTRCESRFPTLPKLHCFPIFPAHCRVFSTGFDANRALVSLVHRPKPPFENYRGL